MPISTEKNLDTKLNLLKDWFVSEQNFDRQSISITPHNNTLASGFSNETFVFKLTEKNYNSDLVLRLAPTGYRVFPDYNLKKQVSIMKTLFSRGFPVPEVLFYEGNSSVIGSEFYIMNYIKGEAPSDNPPYHLDPDGMMGKADSKKRRNVWIDWLLYLSNLHNLDLKDISLDDFCEDDINGNPVISDIEYYKDFLDWGMDGEPNNLCDDVINWLKKNIPSDSNPNKLCWGDSRLGNVLYQDYKATALLDWEMASIGDPISDLAWGFAVDDASSLGLGIKKLEGSLTSREAIDIWEKNTNLSSKNYKFYRIFSLLKFSIIMIRVAKKLVINNIIELEKDFYKNNYISNFLEKEFKEI